MSWRARICQFLHDQKWTDQEIIRWLYERKIETMGGRTPDEVIEAGEGERLWKAMVLPDETPAGRRG